MTDRNIIQIIDEVIAAIPDEWAVEDREGYQYLRREVCVAPLEALPYYWGRLVMTVIHYTKFNLDDLPPHRKRITEIILGDDKKIGQV